MNEPLQKRSLWKNVQRWIDSSIDNDEPMTSTEFNWVRTMPFIILHLACFGVLVTGVSTTAVVVCLALFWLRLFAITAFYHRYFSHRSYKTSRPAQFIFALLGNMSAQRGPLWWAAHHRAHHQHADTDDDLHSPVKRGFWWSHAGWFTCDASFKTQMHRINDFAKYPELRWLDRYDIFAPMLLLALLFVAGELLAAFAPALETNGLQLIVWGFVISTVILFHSTVTINSLGHIWGKKRFNNKDESRNNAILALLTLGEGWHNNHHRWAVSARQGFYWYEIDITYGILKVMSWLGIVWDLSPVPAHVLEEGRRANNNRKDAK
ncbi:MAG: acyl-CoA desaturase [Thalassolituus sp.]|jgi:stearoyl-CoA desaturase (delta-9 desaturase)|uniref:Fatty-acid desaturase n=2 Tax=root TaxID=1 RepID=M5DTH4_9GAMM|nr:acyl-CoA desaturase [Thalassolituus oleivorans]MCA6128286.1 stearoyl-CoA 9-desaturase [Thalassolituus oleivorans 4BN06-13]PCI46578.1 MAG: acyl-CoA desaturase [Oceanospirillales bacterium]CCU73206.1 Fatty-acid desaturase [Thalassolituus oleivorans MIL-1]